MEFPEHQKLKNIKDQSQWLGDFLDWASYNGLNLYEWMNDKLDGEVLIRVPHSIESLLARYFKIDLNKIEEEKRTMLDQMRKGKSL